MGGAGCARWLPPLLNYPMLVERMTHFWHTPDIGYPRDPFEGVIWLPG